jgi:hypothetical protein
VSTEITIDFRSVSLAKFDVKLVFKYVRFEVFTPVTMKNVDFWDIKTHFVPHRRHITSRLQTPAA